MSGARPLASVGLVVLAVLVPACESLREKMTPTPDAGPAPVAPREMAAAKSPPKPRAMPPLPPLPNLPVLEEQEKGPAAPPSYRNLFGATVDTSSGSCGLVWNGSEVIALPCARNGLLFGRDAKGARALVSAKLLDAETSALARVVDHRFVGFEGPVRNQKTTPACTAFSLAAAMDQAVARWTGKPVNVSAMEIWSRYREPYANKSISENLGKTVGAESSWPFDERTAKGWMPCEPGAKAPKEGCGLPPDPKRVAKLAAEPLVTFTDVTYLDDPDVAAIQSHLAIGEDVIVTVDLPQSFVPKGSAGARYVPHWTTAKPEGGHAMVVAGYAVLPKATYFLLHNSWGAGWGDGGYAWIHAATLEKHMREALVVDAEPVLRDAAKQRRVRGAFTCEPPLVPDAMRGTCAPACPDGSPRSDGVCASSDGCAAGHVNLTGVCVGAAPRTRGSDPKTGIAWSCGPGGCTYELPRRSAPDCKGNTCKASCPAPIFRIATTGDDLTCVR